MRPLTPSLHLDSSRLLRICHHTPERGRGSVEAAMERVHLAVHGQSLLDANLQRCGTCDSSDD